MVEFAIVAVLLFTLVFGVIEFGWALKQQLEVRQGAREGARLAAVDDVPTNSESTNGGKIAREICDRMGATTGSGATVTISPGSGGIGATGTLTVVKPLEELTGFFPGLPSTISESLEFRIEQVATWTTSTLSC